jgi:hypothetical protein
VVVYVGLSPLQGTPNTRWFDVGCSERFDARFAYADGPCAAMSPLVRENVPATQVGAARRVLAVAAGMP